MIVLIGESCAGKSTIEKILGLNRIISYTTRPIRVNETNGVDYHFISDDEFKSKLKKGDFVEHTTYNGWYYAIARGDCVNDAICVVEPNGYRQLIKNKDLHIIAFYIKVSERTRVIRMMKRGDNIMESFRRIISDQGGFNGIENEVNYTVENEDGDLNDAVEKIRRIIDFYKRYK